MQPAMSTWDLVGNTPLVEIKSLSQKTGCRIFAKCEFMNPGGSVKDRAAKSMIAAAEKSGALKPGGILVEGTAGNTGIGLATFAAARGYRCIISMPDNQAQEKMAMLEALGAEVRAVKPVPFANPEHFYHRAKKIAEETPNAFWVNQFENTANCAAHEAGTGEEIWKQTAGVIDYFTCAVGTGGTIAGVSRSLKRNAKSVGREVKVVLADPFGSGLYCQVRDGKMETTGSSVTEGIGIMRVTANFALAQIDEAVRIDDQSMINMLFHTSRQDGLFLGTSAALNLVSAYQLAKRHQGEGKTIVTILCDHGSRYQSKLLSEAWRNEKGLTPQPLI
ncbi:MAG: cysteine synthase A [Deltaproteobacteria bacterium]|nr:cysteine synthase A [Deltaproteobacteria bacterium]